jgi:glutaconate CoA-transferase subunit A
MQDPFSGEKVWVVPRVQPDWAVIHAHEADLLGNARIYGSPFWDRLTSRAAKRVIILAERIIATEEMAKQPELTVVPHIFVEAVVPASNGAWPTACTPLYSIDEGAVFAYLKALTEPDGLARHLAEREEQDYAGDALVAGGGVE